MHTRLAFVAAAVLAAALPAPSAAQEVLAPGTRVRVTVPDQKHPLVGAFVSRTADSLMLEIPARSWNGVGRRPVELVSLPVPRITRLEVSRGRRSHPGRGAGIGALVGAAAGLALGLAASADNSGWFEIGPGEVASATLVMGGIGAGVGAIVGGLSHSERWEATTLPNLPPAPEVPTTAGTIPLVTSRF